MMGLRDVKIGSRLFFVFLSITVLFVFTSGYFVVKLNTIKGLNSNLFNKNLKAIDYLLEADRDAYQSRLAISHMLQYNEKEKALTQLSDVEENLAQIEQRYNWYDSIYHVSEIDDFKLYDSTFRDNYAKLEVNTAKILSFVKGNNFASAVDLYDGAYSSSFDNMRESMNLSTEKLLEYADDDHENVQGIFTASLMFVFIISAVFLAFLIVSGFTVTRSITTPLSKLVKYSRQLAQGDLGIEIEAVGKDEVSQVFSAYKDMMKKLKEIISNIRANANELVHASSSITTVSQSIAQGSNEQAASTEQIASSIEEITSSINQNSNNSQETARIATLAASSIKTGQETMRKVVSAMKEIAERIAVVNQIAENTDLLAINAAVEAARAGEAGKGFAVVATEVRSLAETSHKAAVLIDELVRTNSVNVFEFSDQLEEVVVQVERTANLVQEISAASIEQNSGVGQINSAIQQLNSTTQENSATAEELSTSAEELEGQAEGLKETVNYFILDKREVADKINEMKEHIGHLMSSIQNLEKEHSLERISRKDQRVKDMENEDNMKGDKKNAEIESGININIEDETDSEYTSFKD